MAGDQIEQEDFIKSKRVFFYSSREDGVRRWIGEGGGAVGRPREGSVCVCVCFVWDMPFSVERKQ